MIPMIEKRPGISQNSDFQSPPHEPQESFRNFSELWKDFAAYPEYLLSELKSRALILCEATLDQQQNPAVNIVKEKSMNEIEKEIRVLEDELTQTEMRLDVDALNRIYADDIMVTAPIGICVDKPAVMREVRQAAEKAVIGKYDKNGLKVRAYGDTVVSSYLITTEAEFEGVEIKRELCITNVWMRRDEGWQIVARHTASLPGDTPPTSPA
jgi:ketosteroid isomerase-like protein